MRRPLLARGLHAVFSRVNRRRPWWREPHPFQALNLLSLRLDLRDWNLHDTTEAIRTQADEKPPPEALRARRPDGKWNDLNDRDMGSVDSSFTRNIDPRRFRPEKEPRVL